MRREEALQKLGQLLVERREALRQTLNGSHNSIAVDGDVSADAIDEAVEFEQSEVDTQLLDAESRELALIDEAIGRVHNGNYGICGSCGKSIPLSRLQAVPYAAHCIDCQREEEQGSYAGRSRAGRSAAHAGA